MAGEPNTRFSSSLGLILAALGMAIGTGNLWRFPRVMSENGGGTFLIPWAIFLFTWSIPLLMVEFGLGRRTGRGPVGAFASAFGARTSFMGLFVAMCSILIGAYYAVVTGWCLRYLFIAIFSGFADLTPDTATDAFLSAASGGDALGLHAVALLIAGGVVMLGAVGGIERACKVMIPMLFVIVIVAAIRAVSLPGAGAGLEFMLTVDPKALGNHEVWLDALSQSAWSTGAGWGLLMCYAIYAPRRQRVGLTCVATGVGNNLASLVAALAIIPAVFALLPSFLPAHATVAGTLAEAGPASTGVTFVWMPQLLEEITILGWDPGRLPAASFFLALSVAAISSLIALVELGSRTLMDVGAPRRFAVAAITAGAFLLGAPSALRLEIFENQDWVWGMGLILSGGFLTFGVISHGVVRFLRDYLTVEGSGVGSWFAAVLAGLLPVQFLCLMAWWVYQSFTWIATDEKSLGTRVLEWLDPADRFSIGTCVVQWAVLLAAGIALNRWLASRSARS